MIPDLTAGQTLLVIAPSHIAGRILTDILAHLALCGPVDLIDAGNRFEIYRVARAIRRQSYDLTGVLKHIRLARAFTCYQVLALLARSPADACPKILLDLPATFYDEGLSDAEAYRLLQESIRHLQRLSRNAPVIVLTRPPPAARPERAGLVERLRQAAGDVWVYSPQDPPRQERLF